MLVLGAQSRVSQLVRHCLLALLPFALAGLGFGLINAFPYGLMYDDGYFYAQIAYNLASLGSSSFDGVNVTSGYHLPWAGALTLVSRVVGLFTPSKTAHLYAFLVLFAALALHVARTYFSRILEQLCAFVLVVMGTLLMDTLLLSFLLLLFARLEIGADGLERASRAPAVIAFLVPLVRIEQ